jgi:hypothetical protein
MSLWHRHKWDETSRRFNPPTHEVTKFRADNVGSALPLLYGITVVELRCATCGDMKAIRYTGKAT